jgi:hypothetical protein
VLNWNSLTDTAVQVRLLAKTSPGKQWEVARAMRRYATLALQQASAGAAEVATGAQPAAGDQPAPVEQTASDDGPAPQSEAADPARAQPRETRS